jgi:hypothetical protein
MPTMDTMRPQVNVLDTAGKMLERYLALDSSFPSLVDVTQITRQGTLWPAAIAICCPCAGLSIVSYVSSFTICEKEEGYRETR